MNPILRNILAVIVGLVIGGALNMSLIMVSGHIIPPPEGFDLSIPEELKATMPFMQPKHFLFPFLAHALGTFVGALLAALIAANNKMRFAFAIAIFSLIGGIMEVMTLPSPKYEL
jgi:hypothetical protein